MAKGDKPIIVVGGGIGGLACALALARKGRAAHVLEQASEFREVGAGIQLGPNTFKMFDRLGLTAAADAVAAYPGNLVMMDGVTGEEATPAAPGGMRRSFRLSFAV